MGFIADVRLTHDELPLVPTMKRQPDLTLRREYETTSNGTQMQFVSVFGDETDALEEVLADDATISAATKVATFGQRSIYRLTIDTHLEIVPGQCSECGYSSLLRRVPTLRGVFDCTFLTESRWRRFDTGTATMASRSG